MPLRLERRAETSAVLQIGAPQKQALQDYMDANGGTPPPMVKLSQLIRINVRRSS